MEITSLIMENHGIVFLNFCGNPVRAFSAYTRVGTWLMPKFRTLAPLDSCLCHFKMITVNVLKFRTSLFLFLNEMLVIRAGIPKMLFRIANMECTDQTASLSGSALFVQAFFFGRQLMF